MRSQRGFNLIELMIAALIIAILSAIVMPLMKGYMDRARRTQAVAAIGEMQVRLERWRAENPTYLVASGAAGFGAFPTPQYYTLTLTNATATSYTLTATGTGLQASSVCNSYVLAYNAGATTKTPTPGTTTCW